MNTISECLGIEVTLLAHDGWGYPYPPHEDPVVRKEWKLRVRITNKSNSYNSFIHTRMHRAQKTPPFHTTPMSIRRDNQYRHHVSIVHQSLDFSIALISSQAGD